MGSCSEDGDKMETRSQQRLPLVPISRTPHRVGTAGRRVRIACNYFDILVSQLPTIYQYSFKILKKRPRRGLRGQKRAREEDGNDGRKDEDHFGEDIATSQPIPINRRIFRQYTQLAFLEEANKIAYDGRNILYSPVDVDFSNSSPLTMLCDEEGNKPRNENQMGIFTVNVVVEKTASIATDKALTATTSSSLAAIQPYLNSLDVALAMGLSSRFIQVGRSFYSGQNAIELGSGVQAWRGFYQSVRLTERGGLAINLDESFTPFWKEGELTKLCCDAAGGRMPPQGDSRAWRRIGKDLHGLRVKASHTGIRYRIFGFSERCAWETTFADEKTGQSVSIAEYMDRQYGVRLQFPQYPCAKTSPTKRTFVPIELLRVCPNQRRNKAMDPAQTSAMIKTAAMRPDRLRESVQRSMAAAAHNRDRVCQAFGTTIQTTPKEITARIIEPPELEYAPNNPCAANNTIFKVRNGAWNMHNLRVLKGATISTWVPIRIGGNRDDNICYNFLGRLVHMAEISGMQLRQEPQLIRVLDGHDVEEKLDKLLYNIHAQHIRSGHKQGLEMAVLILDRPDPRIYACIKRVCDIKLGIASQCVVIQKIRAQHGRKMDQYCANVLLKVNTKLSGCNALVREYDGPSTRLNPTFLRRPHIVLGADVSHPSPGPGSRPSVAALVGSCDKACVQFSGSLRNQPPRQEIIADLGAMFLEVYQRWLDHFDGKMHAETIIMFRDGVSEGQYQQVLDVELNAIRKACYGKWRIKPRITYIIVTKRHHSRFFKTNNTRPTDVDRNNNILPGTVIDQGITNPHTWEFYLNSHASIQGTNKPAKYTVLWDENEMSGDELQGYVYRLAHGFSRCTRAVSMVNAAYYAHLLAFRGRLFISDDDSERGSISLGWSPDLESVPKAMKPHAALEHRLFFV